MKKGTPGRVLSGPYAGSPARVLAEDAGRVRVLLRFGGRGIVETLEAADFRVDADDDPREPLWREVRDALDRAAVGLRRVWWAARAREGVSADAALYDRFLAYEAALDEETTEERARTRARFDEAFGSVDGDALTEAWRRERVRWTDVKARLPPVADEAMGRAEHLEREACGAWASRLRDRIPLSMPPRERIAVDSDVERALAGATDDDPTWGVYADWLAERGDPHGHLGALQDAPGRVVRGAVRERADPLVESAIRRHLVDHAEYLFGGLAGYALDAGPRLLTLHWRHGFVHEASLYLPAIDDAARALVPAVLDHPSARFLRELDVRHLGGPHDYAPIVALLCERAHPNVRRLVLGRYGGPPSPLGDLTGLDAAFPDLRYLALLGEPRRLGGLELPRLQQVEIHLDDDLAEEVERLAPPSLQAVDVQEHALTDRGWAAIRRLEGRGVLVRDWS